MGLDGSHRGSCRLTNRPPHRCRGMFPSCTKLGGKRWPPAVGSLGDSLSGESQAWQTSSAMFEASSIVAHRGMRPDVIGYGRRPTLGLPRRTLATVAFSRASQSRRERLQARPCRHRRPHSRAAGRSATCPCSHASAPSGSGRRNRHAIGRTRRSMPVQGSRHHDSAWCLVGPRASSKSSSPHIVQRPPAIRRVPCTLTFPWVHGGP